MNINPISFGKTIKVQNEKLAYQVRDIANRYHQELKTDRFEKQVAKTFDDIRSDYWAEQATVWETDDGFYVLSGKEAKESMKYRAQYEDAIENAGRYYGAGDLLDISIETYGEDLNKQITELIERTKEPYTLATEVIDGKTYLKKIDEKTSDSPMMNHGEGIFTTAYNDMLALGLNESDAYMQALLQEEELLEFNPHRN